MNNPPRLIRSATLADLEALPRTWRGEIIDGTLYAFPRPRSRHAYIELSLGADLNSPFMRGRGGPGGWWILPEPGIELPRSPEFSPGLAGWRRERMPRLPPPKKAITIVPDWVCEILSPSTASYDNLIKRRYYAEIGVGHIWYIDLARKELEVPPRGCAAASRLARRTSPKQPASRCFRPETIPELKSSPMCRSSRTARAARGRRPSPKPR